MDNDGAIKEFTDNLTTLWPQISTYQWQFNTQANYDKPFLDISHEENEKEIPLSSFLFGPKLAARPLPGLEPISSEKIAQDLKQRKITRSLILAFTMSSKLEELLSQAADLTHGFAATTFKRRIDYNWGNSPKLDAGHMESMEKAILARISVRKDVVSNKEDEDLTNCASIKSLLQGYHASNSGKGGNGRGTV